MERKTRPVTSREYKVMLNARCFAGSKSALLKVAEQFRQDLKSTVKTVGSKLSADAFAVGKKKKQATVTFLDTKHQSLRNADWVFRARQPLSGGQVELTLKRRHRDRFYSSAAKTGGKPKFEEDVKVSQTSPFTVLHSLSAKQQADDIAAFKTVADLFVPFPPLAQQLPASPSLKLRPVGGVTAIQTVLEGPRLEIDNVKLKCAMIIWHAEQGGSQVPVVVEFSFRCKDEDIGPDAEPFSSQLAIKCYELMQAFRVSTSPLGSWSDLTGPTKTRYVYELDQPATTARLLEPAG